MLHTALSGSALNERDVRTQGVHVREQDGRIGGALHLDDEARLAPRDSPPFGAASSPREQGVDHLPDDGSSVRLLEQRRTILDSVEAGTSPVSSRRAAMLVELCGWLRAYAVRGALAR